MFFANPQFPEINVTVDESQYSMPYLSGNSGMTIAYIPKGNARLNGERDHTLIIQKASDADKGDIWNLLALG